MKEKAEPPVQISNIDLDRPNPETPGDTAIDGDITREETLKALQTEPADPSEPASDDESDSE